MKKIISKIAGFVSFMMMYLVMNANVALAAEETIPVPESVALDGLLSQFAGMFGGSLIVLGIAAVVPAIICLLVAYASDKKSETGRSILGWVVVLILSSIPVVSLIMLFIWAFGEKTKSDPTFRNYARLVLLGYLYGIIFTITYFLASMFLI